VKAIWIKDETAVRLKFFDAGEDTWDELIVKLLNIAESPCDKSVSSNS
jgi:hypothetical protein